MPSVAVAMLTVTVFCIASNKTWVARLCVGHLIHTVVLFFSNCAPLVKLCFSFLTWTHTQPFNGPFSGTTQVSRYQKGRTNLDFTEARDSEWHQLGQMQVCTSLQTDNHASSTPQLFFYRPDAFPASQPTASKHWRRLSWRGLMNKINKE